MAVVCVCLIACFTNANAQDESTAKTFEEQSVALRTALHYDPSLGQPLRTLVELYEKAERLDELLGLYRAHTSQYPDDAGAQVVLIRLLKHLQRPEAMEMLQSAVQQFPEQAMLQYLQFEWYKKSDDARALTTLSKAVELQTIPDRRDTWMDELLELSRSVDDNEVAEKHLMALRDAAGTDSAALLAAAQRMHRYDFYELAIETLTTTLAGSLEPEARIEVEMLMAKSEAAIGKRAEAGRRVAALLDTVAADYWRRRELMTLRMQLVESPAERDKLLELARDAYEASEGATAESAALDYSELLGIAGKRAEAAKVLVDVSAELPKSERIEKAALEALERVGDEEGMRKYLEQRSAEQPQRSDLRYLLVQAQYLAGEDAAAEKNLDDVLAALEGDEKIERLLDLARYLRKANLGTAAVSVQRRVVEAWPQRLDVRRELAETLIGLEQRSKAAEVIRDSDFEGAEIENFLDLVQFMVQSEFHVEARDALRRRLQGEPDNFDLKLLLVEVLAKTSEREAGEKLLTESRELADTAVHYRRWVETGLAFHKVFDDAEMFFDREQFGFAVEETEGDAAWNEDRIARFLGLIEAGSEDKLDARVTQALRNQLARTDLPEELSLQLRSLLVKTLESAPEHAVEVEQHLRELSAADPARASAYDLRRALLYHGAQRPDLAQELIAEIELVGITDQALLRAAYVMFLDYGSVRLAVDCVERLAEQNPDDLINYQRQLALYAALGEEESLRRTLRQLLTGVDRVQFQPETLAALRAHLLDSFWRSISGEISKDSAEAVALVTELLDAVERESLSSSDRLWVLWTRAWLLNRSGQQEGRDAVLAELEAALAAVESTNPEQPAQIIFPDGIGTTLTAAREMLTLKSEPDADPVKATEAEGPLGQLSMAWAFETDGGARLLQIEEAGDLVLALDEWGTVYCMDGANGKLQWRERLLVPDEGNQLSRGAVTSASGGLGSVSNVVQGGASEIALREVQLSPQIVLDGEGNFLLPLGDSVECRAIADGSLKWATDLSLENGTPPWAATHDLREARPTLEMTVREGRVLAFAPAIGVAAAIESVSGKLIWLRTLTGTEVENGEVGGVFDISSGAAFGDNGQMLVFGAHSEILDQEDGKTLWSLGLKVPRRFPVQLRSLSEEELAAQDASPKSQEDSAEESPELAALSAMGVSISHGADAGIRLAAAGNFVKFSGSLLAPAAEWVRRATRSKGGFAHDAEIINGDLILAGVGLYRISLDLPVAAKHFESESADTWLGAAGSHTWMFDGAGLRSVDLEAGEELRLTLDEVAGEQGVAAAVLRGSRIYVSGDLGVQVINAYNGSMITRLEWPTAFSAYRKSRAVAGAGEWSDLISAQRVWQGSVFGRPGQPLSCVPDVAHLQVSAHRLYVATGGGGFAALQEKAD